MGIKEYSNRKRALLRLLNQFIEAFEAYMGYPEIKKLVDAAVRAYHAAVSKTDLIYFGYMRLN